MRRTLRHRLAVTLAVGALTVVAAFCAVTLWALALCGLDLRRTAPKREPLWFPDESVHPDLLAGVTDIRRVPAARRRRLLTRAGRARQSRDLTRHAS